MTLLLLRLYLQAQFQPYNPGKSQILYKLLFLRKENPILRDLGQQIVFIENVF